MVRERLDVVEEEFVEVLPALPVVVRALDDVEEMRDDAGGSERLAVVVEIDAPRIAGAVGETSKVCRVGW